MTMRAGLNPASRISKRQITAYLEPELDAAVRRRVAAEGATLQQFLGRAINRGLEARGVEPFLTTPKQHIFVRRQRAATPRESAMTTPGRLGRKCLAGWFERNEVERLLAFCQETGDTMQSLAEAGLQAMLSDAS